MIHFIKNQCRKRKRGNGGRGGGGGSIPGVDSWYALAEYNISKQFQLHPVSERGAGEGGREGGREQGAYDE